MIVSRFFNYSSKRIFAKKKYTPEWRSSIIFNYVWLKARTIFRKRLSNKIFHCIHFSSIIVLILLKRSTILGRKCFDKEQLFNEFRIDRPECLKVLPRGLSNDTGFVKAASNAPISLVNLSPRMYVHTHAIEVANYLGQFERLSSCRAINRKSFFRLCAVSAIINFQSNAGSSSVEHRQKRDDDAPRLSRATRKCLVSRNAQVFSRIGTVRNRESVIFVSRWTWRTFTRMCF